MVISLLPEEYREKEKLAKEKFAQNKKAPVFDLHQPEARPGESSEKEKPSVAAPKVLPEVAKPEVVLKKSVFAPPAPSALPRESLSIARPEQTVELPVSGSGTTWTAKQKIILGIIITLAILLPMGAIATRYFYQNLNFKLQSLNRQVDSLTAEKNGLETQFAQFSQVQADLAELRNIKLADGLLAMASLEIANCLNDQVFLTDIVLFNSEKMIINGRGDYYSLFKVLEACRQEPFFSEVTIDGKTEAAMDSHLNLTKGGLPEKDLTSVNKTDFEISFIFKKYEE